MKCRFRTIGCGSFRKGFSLFEVMGAVVILGMVCGGVFVSIDRSLRSSTDSMIRMQAFEVARENMERILASVEVSENIDYGESEKYPGVEWMTAVEVFSEPVSSNMWVRGVSTAEYVDTSGEKQTVELTCWLAEVSKSQAKQIAADQAKEEEFMAAEVIETVEEAALFAGVDEETIEEWVENGMPTTADGRFIKESLIVYADSGGKPDIESKRLLLANIAPFVRPTAPVGNVGGDTPALPGTGDQGTNDSGQNSSDSGKGYEPISFEDMTWEEIMAYIQKVFSQR